MGDQRLGVMALGGFVLALVGAGLWLVMQGPPVPNAASADGDASVETAADPETDESAEMQKSRRRAGRSGQAGIFGTVEGKDEKPAANQTVTLRRENAEPWTATTDDEGAFQFDKLPAGGPYEVSVTAEGFAPVVLPGIALDRREQRDVGKLVLAPAVRITVLVKGYDDAPIAGAAVEAFAASSGAFVDWAKRLAQIGVKPVAVKSQTTDAEGKTVFEGMAVGSWTMVAAKDGFARGGRKTYRKADDDDEDRPVTIRLGTGFTVNGSVITRDGDPVAGALLLAVRSTSIWDPGSTPLHGRALAAEDGSYRLEGLAPGNVGLWVGLPGGVPSAYATLRVPDVDRLDLVIAMGGTLTGKVTLEPDDEPAVDVTVRAQSWNGFSSRIAEAVTDEEGRYVIDTLLEGTINSVTAEVEGYAQVYEAGQQAWQQIPLNEGDTVVRDIRMRKAATLTGTVTGPDGPIAAANVTAYTNAGMRGFVNKSGKTDRNGVYTIAGLDSGKTMVTVRAKGHYQKDMPEQWWQAMQSGSAPEEYLVEVPEDGSATRDIRLEAGSVVTGRVEDADGAPVANASVSSSGGGASITEKTGEDGTFRLQGVNPGAQRRVNASKKGYAGAAETVNVSADEPTADVVLRLVPTGTVRGVITPAAGLELRDAYVQVMSPPSKTNQQPWQWQDPEARFESMARAPVAADGSYEIEMTLGKGSFVIRAVALDHRATLSEPQDVVEGQGEYDVDVQLGVGEAARGRVIDAETKEPVAGALVRMAAANTANRQFGVQPQVHRSHPVVAVTGVDGSFSIERADEGKYTVSAQASGFVDAKKTVTVPAKDRIELAMQPELEITGTVKLPDGAPVGGAMIQVQRASSGTPMGGYNPNQVVTGSDGTFRVTGLRKGEYNLIIQPSWSSALNIKNRTEGGVAAGTEGLDITVEAGGTITGKILGLDGKGVMGIYVNAQPEATQPGGSTWRGTSSGKDGTFSIAGLSSGTYTLHVQTSWGAGSAYQPVQKKGVPVGGTDVVIQLAAGFSIEGTVTDDEGGPVAGLQLYAQALQEEGQAQVISNWTQAQSDSKGKFVMRGLAPGHYRIQRQNWAGQQGPKIDKSQVLDGGQRVAAGTKGVRLTITKGATIEGVVVTPDGRGVKVGVSAQPMKGGMGGKSGMSDDTGRFVIEGLLRDVEYRLSAHSNEYKPTQLENVLGGATGVRLELKPGVKVIGQLLDRDGAPLANATLMFQHVKTNQGSSCRTDQDGNFTQGGLDEGTYKVKVYQQKTNEDGTMTWDQRDIGDVDAPATGVVLRLPAE